LTPSEFQVPIPADAGKLHDSADPIRTGDAYHRRPGSVRPVGIAESSVPRVRSRYDFSRKIVLADRKTMFSYSKV
jgi:hypothetical protein